MSVKASRDSSKPRWRWLWVFFSLVVFVGVVVLLFSTEDTANVTRTNSPPALPIVTVIDATSAEAVARISAFAELRSRWDAEIRAAVSGRIMVVHDAALAGERVEVGAPLFSIEKTPYETRLAAAELSLEQAKLALLQARNDAELAREDIALLKISEPNELALRLPQLSIAERTVASAEAQLAEAQRQLADTEVTAPFSGITTNRMVSLGQTVAVGEALLHLSDDRQYELIVELNETDWALLEHPIAGQNAQLIHRNGTLLGEARIRQGGGYLDKQTRQPRIFLTVADPSAGLVAGDFVRVEFAGRTIANTLTIPEAALTRAGHIWMVDADDLLVRIAPEILFRADGMLVIAAPEGAGPWRVATTPLASFLPGVKVAPQTLNEIVAPDQLAKRQGETTPNIQNRR